MITPEDQPLCAVIKWAGSPAASGPGPLLPHFLEEDPQCRIGWAALARERRRVMQIDLDMRSEDERRADVVAGADELLESPPQDRFSFRLVY